MIMARICDEVAREVGEIGGGTDEGEGKGKELADRVAREGGDCCVPKKK